MLKFLILLPCILLVADAGEYDTSNACHRLKNCQDIISDIDFEDSSPITYVRASTDAVCGQQSELLACIAEKEGACSDDDVHKYISEVSDVVEYMCSSGRQLANHLSTTECATGSSYEERYFSAETSCEDDFNSGIQNYAATAASVQPTDFCQFVDELTSCMGREVGNLCGNDMGTFVETVFGIEVAREMYSDFLCSDASVA